MASAQPEVIYKGWLKKSTEPDANAKKKNFLNRSSSWKKRYVVLLRQSEDNHDVAVVAIFDKDVAHNFNKPRASLKLSPWYRVDKKYDPTGKQHIFEIRTSKTTWRFLADSQTVMDLWVFYLQIQTKLRTDFPGRCFEVSPDDSESMRRIGARASQCLLHLSKWGLTLALKRTRSLVGQWPLKCIREFESSETGRFSFKAGRSSPMGSADYVFATVLGQDGEIYDLLDAYTTEDISGQQPQIQSGQASAEVVNQDYERLRLATFGLLPRRGSEGRPTSPNHTQHSQAVPVPGRTKNYDRLDRSRDGSNHKLDRSKSDNVKRTQAAPPVPARTPSLPPKGTSRPPSASSSINMESDYNLPYADMGGRTVEEESLPYTEMGSNATLKRQAFGRDSKDRMSWDLPIPRTLTNSTAASDRTSYQSMDYTPQSYRNTLTMTYENTPLISPSPQARGMSNGGFVNSPLQSAMTELTIQDHDYHMVESTLGATSGNGSGPPSPLVHTYFEGEFAGSKGSSGEREHYYQGVDYEGVAPEGSMMRTSSLGNLRSPTSITDSYIDRSPNLGSLDLAFSFSPANMPNWMNDRQLPSLPRNEGPPTEENPYVVSPKKSLYAYEDVNNIFPPTPAQGAQQTDYESVSNTSAEEINVENHVLRQSTFSEGYVDSNLAQSRTSESFQPNTARLVMQDLGNTAHTAVVEPGVMYAQVVATVPAAEIEPKEEKRKSFKARTLDRVKMKKSKSLVDLSVANKSPERKSMALEDLDKKKESSTLGRPKKMKKSQSNPNLLVEQTPSAAEAMPQFISAKKGPDKQSPVTGVRRKFGLGLKIMRQKSKNQDDDSSESPGKPKPLPRKMDIKGISTTDKTKSYTRRSQGQLNDLPLDGGVESKTKQRNGAMVGKRQRAVSAGNAMSVQSMLNEQSNSTGMITNPLSFGSQSLGGSVDEPALDEQGYLSPSEIGSPVKMISDPLEADMSDRPLPERPLPSPPSHSQSAPLMKARNVNVTQVWEL